MHERVNSKDQSNSLFQDLIGHSKVVQFLQAALFNGRLAPAYLFSGPQGVGKSLAASLFLEGVLSSGKSDLREKKRLLDRNHPDLIWIEPTYQHQGRLLTKSQSEAEGISRPTPPQIRIEQIREVTRFLARKPLEAERGMVVIESAESMAEATSNALLKTLEEPGHGLIVLISAFPGRLLTTIRSRCQIISFGRLDSSSLKQVLLKKDISCFDSLDLASDKQELFEMADGSPGELLRHIRISESIPNDFWLRLRVLPNKPIDALSFAKDITEALTGEQQLWIIDWLQVYLWSQYQNANQVKRLSKLRSHLLRFVQPRLAWEVALLEMIE